MVVFVSMDDELFVKRVIAYVIDLLVLGAILGVVWTILGIISSALGPLGIIIMLVSQILLLVGALVYDPLFKYLGWDGQTLGKKIMKLKVVKEGGELTIKDLAIRSFLRFFAPLNLVSLIWYLVEKKTLHEKKIKTKVVPAA